VPNSSKPYLNFIVDPELLKRIDDFRFRSRFPTRASGIKWLLDWALKQEPVSEPSTVPTLVPEARSSKSDETIDAQSPEKAIRPPLEVSSLHAARAGTVVVLGTLPALQYWKDTLDSQHPARLQYASEIETLFKCREIHVVCEETEDNEVSIAEQSARKYGCSYVKLSAHRDKANAWHPDEHERHIADRTRIATIGNQRSAIVICHASRLPGLAQHLANDCRFLVIRNLITERSFGAALPSAVK
jgi:hypothetical protein